MPVAYTPGLRVTPDAAIRQQRRLPVRGEVLVQLGQMVQADQVLAQAEMPGHLHTISAADTLRVEPQELPSLVTKRSGDAVKVGEIIARTEGLWGLLKTELKAPVSGVVEEVSAVSGHVRIREHPRRIEVLAHVPGRVAEIIPGEGAIIETRGALVQGIFGVGGERRGTLRVIGDGPDALPSTSLRTGLQAEQIGECRGCVLVAGAGAEAAAVRAAAEAGAVGLIVGAVQDEVLRQYVGYDIGVAITGQEDLPMTLILTEGFGELPMARRTWELLSSLQGQLASINGATQIRAGVIRPEVVVARGVADQAGGAGLEPAPTDGELGGKLEVGSRVRIIREPHFGALGQVTALPVELTEIETESRVRVAIVRLDDGQEVRVPRANLELTQE